MEIRIPRGDYRRIMIKNLKEQLSENDTLIMSVKDNVYSEEYILQKSLGNGIEWSDHFERYIIELTHYDTDKLLMNVSYPFDIVIVYGDKPQTTMGTLRITEEVTRNEV